MSRSLTLYLAAFGREALERSARDHGGSPSAVVRAAALAYLADGRPERLARRPPPRLPGRGRGERPVSVRLDEELWVTLVREAELQHVEPVRLVEHTMLLYLADLDSGRVAARVGKALRGDD